MSRKSLVANLVRGESQEETLALLAIQTDQTMNLVEAIASVLLACAHACREEEAAKPDAQPLPASVWKAFARLDEAMAGGPT